jgi:hypothetical protein
MVIATYPIHSQGAPWRAGKGTCLQAAAWDAQLRRPASSLKTAVRPDALVTDALLSDSGLHHQLVDVSNLHRLSTL